MKMKNAVSELPYPRKFKAILSSLHSDIIDYALAHYDGTNSFKRKIVDCMNSVSCHIMNGDTLPSSIINNDGNLSDIRIVDSDDAKRVIGDLFIMTSDADWSGFEIVEKESEEHPLSSSTFVFLLA